MPLCRTPEGCPIEAEAKNPTIQKLISGYVKYKTLNRAGAPDALQIQALDNCGALELCPEFLADMEPIFNKFINKIQDEQKSNAEAEKNRLVNIQAQKDLVFNRKSR